MANTRFNWFPSALDKTRLQIGFNETEVFGLFPSAVKLKWSNGRTLQATILPYSLQWAIHCMFLDSKELNSFECGLQVTWFHFQTRRHGKAKSSQLEAPPKKKIKLLSWRNLWVTQILLKRTTQAPFVSRNASQHHPQSLLLSQVSNINQCLISK